VVRETNYLVAGRKHPKAVWGGRTGQRVVEVVCCLENYQTCAMSKYCDSAFFTILGGVISSACGFGFALWIASRKRKQDAKDAYLFVLSELEVSLDETSGLDLAIFHEKSKQIN
jgi:hypothetical protein